MNGAMNGATNGVRASSEKPPGRLSGSVQGRVAAGPGMAVIVAAQWKYGIILVSGSGAGKHAAGGFGAPNR